MRRGVRLLARLLTTLGLIVSAAPIGAQSCSCQPKQTPSTTCAMACCAVPVSTPACHADANQAGLQAPQPTCGCELQPAPSHQQPLKVEQLAVTPDWVASLPVPVAVEVCASTETFLAPIVGTDSDPPDTSPLAPDAGRAPPAL